MRTIKFRGRHLCGQWYYGNLIVRETDSPVPETPQAYKCVMIGDVEDGSAEEVEENTIGQFTGLQDSKGNDIYEGDIIESDHKIIHEIYYQEIDARFMAACDGNRKFLSGGVTQNWIDEFNKVVIGNIHDNPELLKGGEK